MEKITCKWCNNNFSTVTNLKIHQRTTKYCLRLRGKLEPVREKCEWCEKEFSTKGSLQRHTTKSKCRIVAEKDDEICRLEQKLEKKRKIIESLRRKAFEKEDENGDLKKEIRNLEIALATKEGIVEGIQIAPIRSQTVNNVHPKLINIPVENLSPFTVETIQAELLEGKFTEEMFKKGLAGIVEFVSGMITFEGKDGTTQYNYACTDSSRNKFHRLLASKEWQEDNGAHFLTSVIEQLENPVTEIYSDLLAKKRSASNEVDQKYYSKVVDVTEPIYQGVKYGGKDRKKLFTGLRCEIRSIAAV